MWQIREQRAESRNEVDLQESVDLFKRFLTSILLSALCSLLWAAPAAALSRHLATDCTYDSAFIPSEAAPFDLDWCTLNDGDEVTQLLTEIRAKWPSGFAVRAPSKSLSVVSDYIVWPTATKFYYFLEDQDPANKLLIQHKVTDPQTCIGAACNGFWVMWHFENFNSVKIGGPNLSITLRGNHPGLANCDQHYRPALQIGWDANSATICDINKGLVEFYTTDGSLAALADFRANMKYAQQYGVYTWGAGEPIGGTTNKIQQLNVAGTFYATGGVFFHAGVKNAWADPDKTVVSDPYMRSAGWDGVVPVPGRIQDGLPMGCTNGDKDQVRMSTFSGYYVDSIKGGITVLYGGGGWVQRLVGRVGVSADDPFVVKIKDWGVTGPNELGYQAGVRVKKTTDNNFFKGDPHDTPDTGQPLRFVRFEKLPDTYGSGQGYYELQGCAWNNYYADGPGNFLRLENSTNGTNRDWYVTLSGDFRKASEGGTWDRGDLFYFAFDNSRSYRHTLRVAAGTTITDRITLYDTDTVTGPGTFTNLSVSKFFPTYETVSTLPTSGNFDERVVLLTTDQLMYEYLYGQWLQTTTAQNNTITATNVSGSVTIDADTKMTTLTNVNFTGAARAIISVAANSIANISSLCAPAGSSITGTGTVTYNGTPITLPYTFSSGVSECSTGNPPTPCDVNADGTTNVLDVQLEVNMALHVANCSADINLDGTCNVIDLQRVVNAAMGGACVSP